MQLPANQAAAELGGRLASCGYTVDAIRGLLGTVASDALDRNATVPARRVLAGDNSALGVAVRLFLLGELVSTSDVEYLLGDDESLAGLLVAAGEGVRSTLELAPYASDRDDWLIASDWSSGRTGRPTTAEHVLGVGGASTMLAQCTVRPNVERALDIGTGCGIQAFHLAQHADYVVATDISARCLAVAGFNAAMNGVDVELGSGSLFAPVEGEKFDLIVSNPPFVIASPQAERHDYRDSGMAGDEVCARLVRESSRHLADGGWCQLLANWEIIDGDDWAAGPRSWLHGSPLDAWVVQRDVQDPATYVETWLRDAGDHWRSDYQQVYSSWLDALERRGVIGIGFGLVTLRRGRNDQPIRTFQHVPQPMVQPVGPDVARWFAAQDLLVRHVGAEVLSLPWSCADDVEVIREFAPTASGSQSQSVVRRTGFAWSGSIDDFGVGMLAGADGRTQLGQVLLSLADQLGVDPTDALAVAVPIVRQLVAEGFLYLPD